jgi:hypothetical protein
MSALESSPVHCLNRLPSGKRRWPGNGGAAAILIYINITYVICEVHLEISPIINVCHYCGCSSCAMCKDEVLTNPGDEVVLECAFDDLVEEIRAQQFMDIGVRKPCRERLYYGVSASRLR